MPTVSVTRQQFLDDRQGRTFADIYRDEAVPFDQVLAFFNDADRQRRMEEAEIHHNRPPLAGVVRELESVPEIDRCLATQHPRITKRLRQAVGVVVRIVMEAKGWKRTGKKGSLGVRALRTSKSAKPGAYHNSGGLAFWFLRAERYELAAGMPYQAVRARSVNKSRSADKSSSNRLTSKAATSKSAPKKRRPQS